jgi:ATP-binding cassette subfamily A (ABC1) protein 3
VGWCPQDDAVFDYLTVAEHLELFHALLRAGAPASTPASTDAAPAAAAAPNDQGAISAALARLGLTPHAHKAAVALSGGMRRRLTLALACAGDPHLLLLDEPTRCAEPYSARGASLCGPSL